MSLGDHKPLLILVAVLLLALGVSAAAMRITSTDEPELPEPSAECAALSDDFADGLLDAMAAGEAEQFGNGAGASILDRQDALGCPRFSDD